MTAPLLSKDEHEADAATAQAAEPTAAAVREPAEEAAREAVREAPAAGESATADAQDQSDDAQTDELPAPDTLTATEELPAPAARDALHLFAQSPRQLFLHWSLAADPFAALRAAFADLAARYRLVVRLFDLNDATEQLHDASPARAQWLAALPDRDYRADLGLHAGGLPFVLLLSSAVVRTPRASVSPDADAAPEFHITPADFSRLLDETGYAPERHPTGDAPRDATTTHDRPATTPFAYCYFSSGQWEVRSSKFKVQS